MHTGSKRWTRTDRSKGVFRKGAWVVPALLLLPILTAGATTIYTFPLDDDPGWAREGQWGFGTPSGGSHCGNPRSGYTGVNVYGYNISGNYDDNMPEYFLTTPALNFSNYANVTLSFRRWMGVESALYDHARIQVSNDGSIWTDVWRHTGGSFCDGAWLLMTYDISAAADGRPTVYVRWGMGPTDSSVTYPGWNIDDIVFTGDLTDNLRINPGAGLSSSGYEGGPFAPDSIVYAMENTGVAPLDWTASRGASWLSLSSAGGTLDPGALTTLTVAINADANVLPPGAYADAITFTNTTTGFVQTRPVTLEVNPWPGEISVTDSILPADDHAVPFGSLLLCDQREEQVIIENVNPTHSLVIEDLRLGGWYFEDFEDGLAQGWAPVAPAMWSVEAGEYRGRAQALDIWSQSLYAGKDWSDLSVTADVRRTGAAYYVTSAVFARATADFDCDALTGSAYGLGIATEPGNAAFYVARWMPGYYTFLQSWTSTPYLNEGSATNTITLSVEGAQIRAYINGNLAWSGSDLALSGPGYVGVGGYSGDISPETIHYFDNFSVDAPWAPKDVVGLEQSWHNAQPTAEGTPERSPHLSFAPYEGPADDKPGAAAITRGPFTVLDEPTLPHVLAPGATLALRVQFAPTSPGVFQTPLMIESNDPTTPELEVLLSGEGFDPIQITHMALGDQLDGDLGYVVGAEILSLYPLVRAEVVWRLNGGGIYSRTPLSWVAGDWYEGVIPAQPLGTIVQYYLECEDDQGSVVTLPCDAPASEYGFVVIGTPRLSVSPASLSYVLAPDDFGTQWVELTNIGTRDADWDAYTRQGWGVKSSTPPSAAAFSGSSGPRGPANWAADRAPDTLIVGYRPGVNRALADAVHASLGAQVLHRYRRIPAEVVRIPPDKDLQSAAAAYARNSAVAYAEPNYRVRTARTPNDPRFGDLWGLENTGQTGGTPGADIKAPAAWDRTTGSANVIVGVLDTGIDYTHPDLLDNLWTNAPEAVGTPGMDDDGNGIVDDIFGARWTSGSGAADSGNPMDGHGHGTHCAGTIGAVGDNGIGVAGVAWAVRLMGLKFLDDGGSGYTADAVSALEYAIDQGAHLTSNSWGGGGFSTALADMIEQANVAGQLFIAAAGNNGMDTDATPFYPAGYPNDNVVSVAASDHNDDRADFSNWGATTVDLAAPGVNTWSTVPGGYDSYSGTSMATPHVSGVAALLLSMAPGTPPAELKSWILDGVDVLPSWSGLTVTGGRLNAFSALSLAGVPWLTLTPDSGTLAPGASVMVQVEASAVGMTDGQYEQARVMLAGGADGPVAVLTDLLVALGEFVVSPGLPVVFSGPEGGPILPMSQDYTLRNIGAIDAPWVLSGIPAWMEPAGPTAGVIPPGDLATVSLRLSAMVNGLPWGDYTATLSFEEIGSGSIVTRDVILRIESPESQPFFVEPLDSDPGWSVKGQWAFGAPQGNEGDPTSGHTGGNVYGYNLAGAYENNLPEFFLTTTALDCSGHTNVMVRFRRWLGVEGAVWDQARIQASNDGVTWSDVWVHTEDSFQDTSWQLVTYDISTVADGRPTVYVRWGMGPTDSSAAHSGWNIDDFELLGLVEDDLAIVPAGGFRSSGIQEGPFTPDHANYMLTNRGGAPLHWTAAKSAAWLTVAPVGGTLNALEQATVTVSLTPDANLLPPGTYTDTVVFANTDNGVVQQRPVVLTVRPFPGKLDLEILEPLDQTLKPGETRVLPAAVRINNVGRGVLDWNVARVRNVGLAEGHSGGVPGMGEWLPIDETLPSAAGPANAAGATAGGPRAFRWTPDQPHADAVNVLVYADDHIHAPPNTLIDQALQSLGLPYTAYYDGAFDAFHTDLQTGHWDVVIFMQENYFGLTDALLDGLLEYWQSGGRLIVGSWEMEHLSRHPLWSEMGMSFAGIDYAPPNPVYWWQPDHPLFSSPHAVPEFTALTDGIYGVYGQYVNATDNGISLAGYTAARDIPDNAAMIVHDSGTAIFRGFANAQNSADLDADGMADGLELWVNTIVWLLIPEWLAVHPVSGVLDPGTGIDLTLTYDASARADGFADNAILRLNTSDPDALATPIPASILVQAPAEGEGEPPAEGEGEAPVEGEGEAPDTTPPTVLSTVPVANAVGVPVNQVVSVVFSEAMDAADINAATFTLRHGATPVSGVVAYDAGNRTATFAPDTALVPDSIYVATITTGVRDLAGNGLVADYAWIFVTGTAADATSPEVVLTVPADQAVDVPLNQVVIAVFSETMDPAFVNAGTFTLTRGETSTSGTVTYDVAARAATFTPDAALAPNSAYTARVTTGTRDIAGNGPAQDYVWRFTTVSAPAEGEGEPPVEGEGEPPVEGEGEGEPDQCCGGMFQCNGKDGLTPEDVRKHLGDWLLMGLALLTLLRLGGYQKRG